MRKAVRLLVLLHHRWRLLAIVGRPHVILFVVHLKRRTFTGSRIRGFYFNRST
jgi:hypothetical protein